MGFSSFKDAVIHIKYSALLDEAPKILGQVLAPKLAKLFESDMSEESDEGKLQENSITE
ncbi:hypothetical protein U1121_06795 [Listeria monocytogenes]